MPVPSVRELEAICGGEGRDPAAERNFRTVYAKPIRRISIRFTWLLLHTRLSANQVTVLAILIGIAGAFVAGWLFPRLGLGLTLGGGIVGAIVAATLGAVVLLLVVNLIQRLVS